MEEKGIELVACDESSEGVKPTDRPLHDPALAITTQLSTVLSCRPNAASAVRADQLDPPLCQSVSQGITVRGPIIDEPAWYIRGDGLIEQWLDQSDFCRTGGVYVDCERQAVPIDEDHELTALAPLGGTNAIPPFFAAENVPSAKPSS